MREQDAKKIFANNLNYFLQINNKSQIEVANKLKIKPSTFSSWCTGQKMPRMDKIEMLANYFNIKKSDLIEEHKSKPDIDIRRIERAREKMPDDEKDKMMKLLTLSFEQYFSDDYSDDDIDE